MRALYFLNHLNVSLRDLDHHMFCAFFSCVYVHIFKYCLVAYIYFYCSVYLRAVKFTKRTFHARTEVSLNIFTKNYIDIFLASLSLEYA